MKRIIILTLSMLAFTFVNAQLFTFTFSGSGTCNPTQGNSVSNVANATVSPFSRFGLNCVATANYYNSDGWTTSSVIDQGQYIEVSITANVGYKLDLTSLSFTAMKSSTGPLTARIAHDNSGDFTTNYNDFVPGTTNSTVSWDFSDFSSTPGGAVRFRIYGWGGSSTNGTLRITSFSVNGNVTASSPLSFDYLNSRVGIGTNNPTQALSVNGTILAKKIKVSTQAANWPDYVFATNYNLRSLQNLETFIKQYKHLPDVPSAEEIGKDGHDVGQMQIVLLKKIEELTLYIIELQKQISDLQKNKPKP